MSGKNYTKSDFTAEEICRMIETCGKAGVTLMKLGSFEVQIGQRQPETTAVQLIPQIADKPTSELQKAAEIAKPQGLSEDELTNLMVTNPAAYEQLLMNESEDMANGDSSSIQ